MISTRSRTASGAGLPAVLALLAATGLAAPALAQGTVTPVPGASAPAAPQETPSEVVPAPPPPVAQPEVAAPPAVQPEPVQPPAAAEPAPATNETPAAVTPAEPAPAQSVPAQPVDIGPPESAPAEGTNDMAQTMGHDLSPWGMFIAADWVVKGVMILLAIFSLVTWMIWIAKGLEIGLAKRRARGAVARLDRASSLDAAIEDGRRPMRRGPVAALALTAAAESELSGALPADGVKERVAVALQRIEARSGRRISRGTGLLATIGSTSPFIGLFGTVWGIMNSFIGIAETNTTNLAVVAPGIAEALLATGIGLVAAIPAVIIYNAFARSIAGYRAILADGSASVLRHLSRDLDRRDAGYGPPRAQPAE